MRQIDTILARFPGPVTLYVSRREKLMALGLGVGFLALGVWFLSPDYPKLPGYVSTRWQAIVVGAPLLVCGSAAIWALIVLLNPRAASLTLDADGFEIRRVLRRERRVWRYVSAFHAETTYPEGKMGSPLEQIRYGELDPQRGMENTHRVLPTGYDNPRLGPAELSSLMNEWRGRALARSV